MGKTLFEKIWDKHLIASIDESTNLIFINYLPKYRVITEMNKNIVPAALLVFAGAILPFAPASLKATETKLSFQYDQAGNQVARTGQPSLVSTRTENQQNLESTRVSNSHIGSRRNAKTETHSRDQDFLAYSTPSPKK